MMKRPHENCWGISSKMFCIIFCSLTDETSTLVNKKAEIYKMKTRGENELITKINPKVVTTQKSIARTSEFPKNAATFFEKPFTASLKPA
jgi:hypothetical protein